MSRLNVSQADPISLKVLDVGLNFGAFALFTASLKCEVWAFEMQPHIFTAVDMAMRLSGYRNRVHMFNNAVYERSNIAVYFDSFKTNFGQTKLHQDNHNSDMIMTLRIDEVVTPMLSPSVSPSDDNEEEVLSPENEVFFMKMDIENSEPYALLGMQSLLLEGRIRHIAIEAITPLLLPIFYKIGYTCDIYDDFGGESGCFWPRNLGNANCSFVTYEGIENFYRKYANSYGGMNPHCSLPVVEGNRTRRVNKNRRMKLHAWKFVNKFVRIRNETFLLSRSQTFDDHVYFLSDWHSFLMSGDDRARVDILVELGRIKLEEISYADFFFYFLFDPKRNDFVSKLLQEVVSGQSVVHAMQQSDLPQEDPILQRNVSHFDTMYAEVHVSFLGNTALIQRTTAFHFGRDDPYEYGLEKCVAYGFTNRGTYQLERFAVLVSFADRKVALKSGFEADTAEGYQGNHLDLDRCAQYMAGKLTDYYCAKKAEMSKKDYDDPPVICKRRAEQLSPTASDNSTVLGILVYVGALWGTPAEMKIDLKTTSPERIVAEFCSSYLPWFIRSFLQQYPVPWLQSRWDERGGGDAALVDEQERLSCLSDFEAHVRHMISFHNARRTDQDVEFLQLRITAAASPI
eukprot:gene23333-30241_t